MSRHTQPEPRPALRKAPDGTVHPASVFLSSLAVTVPPDSAGTAGSAKSASKGARKGKKGGKAKKGDPEPVETVTICVEMPKTSRKALRRRATDYGWTAEEAAGHVLRVWADG